MKYFFNCFGIWKKKIIIMGSGSNVVEVYFVLQSEEMFGFDVVVFYDEEFMELMFQGLFVLCDFEIFWQMKKIGDIYFIVVFEMENSDKILNWL